MKPTYLTTLMLATAPHSIDLRATTPKAVNPLTGLLRARQCERFPPMGSLGG
jgi:hypothetical protein